MLLGFGIISKVKIIWKAFKVSKKNSKKILDVVKILYAVDYMFFNNTETFVNICSCTFLTVCVINFLCQQLIIVCLKGTFCTQSFYSFCIQKWSL